MAQIIFKQEIDETDHNFAPLQPKSEEQYCRLCLASDNTQFKELFSPFNTTQRFVEVVEDFAKVTISPEDEFSKLICFICFIKLRESENFKLLIKNSDFKLRNRQRCETTDNNDVINAESDHEKVDVDEIDLKKEMEDDDYINLMEQNRVTVNQVDIKKEPVSSEIEGGGGCNCDLTEIMTSVVKTEDYETEENAKLDALKIEITVEEKENTNREAPLKVGRKRVREPYHLKCPECDKIFNWHLQLKRHMFTHTGNFPFHCPHCDKGFATNTQLKTHGLTHTVEPNFQCEICGKSFKHRNNFVNHKKWHESGKRFNCDQCHKKFASNQALRMHKITIHSANSEGFDFPCTVCTKQYRTRFHLLNHVRKAHKPTELGTCNICGKVVRRLTEHIKIHLKLYKCTVCNQSFGTSYGLKTHAAVHTRQRLFECDICKKTFRFNGSLHKHRKTHDSKNHFKCEFCDQQFKYRQTWKMHLQRVHQKCIN